MFRSIVRPLRVSRFSKTVSFPQNNSSSIPSNRHGFNFDKPPGSRCLAQPTMAVRRNRTPAAISGTEQTQRSWRTRDFIACPRGGAISNPELAFQQLYGVSVRRRHNCPFLNERNRTGNSESFLGSALGI